MALGGVNLFGPDADLAHHGRKAALLSWAVGSGEACTAPILIGLASSHQCIVAQVDVEILQLQRHGRGGLPTCVAVCRSVVGQTPSYVRVHRGRTTADVCVRAEAQVHAASYDSLAGVEMFEEQVQLGGVACNQRRRAGCVDGHAGALQVQAVIEAIRGDGVRTAGGPETTSVIVLGQGVPLILVEATERRHVRRLCLQPLLLKSCARQ
mmetsp:Transcript_25659/g.73260  ORF Transcript_25659/g.73260 Transcript_25659/m.73260 type:complete len:209 (-) Transcript_25659:1449-2075(-)